MAIGLCFYGMNAAVVPRPSTNDISGPQSSIYTLLFSICITGGSHKI